MDFIKAKDKWTLAKEAYEGSGGFDDGSYIDKYPRESDDKYEERQKIAYYENLFAPKVNRYIGYIFKNTPTRSTSNDLIKLIFDNADNKGNNIDVFISNFAKNAKVRGVNLLLVDMPKELPLTLKEQIQNRALPYFVEINPERVIEYKIDTTGKFEYVAFEDTIDNSTYQNQEIIDIIRYYDKNSWAIFDKEGNVLENGSHNLGACPVLIFSETGEFESIGEFTSIAKLAKRHYNLLSELDEILRGETFPILTINADTPSDVEVKIATDNAIAYAKDFNKPEFIAPPAAPAEIYQKRIEDIESKIEKIAYDITSNKAQESGIALDIKFQGLNASLSNFALRLNDLENRAFEVVCKYLSLKNDITITYPKTFNIIDTQKEIGILEEMKNLINSPTYFKLKTLQIISNDLNTIEPDDFAVIASEVEDRLFNLCSSLILFKSFLCQ
jgi:hypothetical protein